MTCLRELDTHIRSIRRRREVWVMTDRGDVWALVRPREVRGECQRVECCCCSYSLWYATASRELLEDTC